MGAVMTESVKLEDFLVEYKGLEMYDPEEIRLTLEMYGEVEIVGKPASYRIKGMNIEINIMGIWCSAYISQLGASPQEVLMRLRTTNKWKIRKVGSRYVIASVKPLFEVAEHEYIKAKKLLEEYTAIELIVHGMGYKDNPDVYRLLMPRIMAIVETSVPFHVVQMTPVEAGKSFFGIWSMRICSWFYTTAPPTPAGLFYDARTGVYGYALTSNGIVFDEIEKWSSTQIELSGIMSYLPTFLENGIVVRPSARTHSLGVIERRINTIWFGNCSQFEGGDEKEVVRQIFMSWGDKHGALLDRMSIVHVETKNIRILDYVTGKILPESLMYAIVDIVRNRNVDTECRSSLSGRLKRHSCAIQRAALKLNIAIEPHIADDIVLCGWSTALDMYGNMNK